MKTLQRWRRSGKVPETAWRQFNQRCVSYSPEWLKEQTGNDIELSEDARRRLLYGGLKKEHTSSSLDAVKKRKRHRGAPGRVEREELRKEAECLKGERRELYWMSARLMRAWYPRSSWCRAKDRREGRIPEWAYVAKNSRVFKYHSALLRKYPAEQGLCIINGIEDASRIKATTELLDGINAFVGFEKEHLSSGNLDPSTLDVIKVGLALIEPLGQHQV